MTLIEIISTFTFYGFDVLALAAVTAIIVQICKKTFLKKVQKKLITFLPFALGTFLYALYAALRHWNFFYILNDYVGILEHGFSVGVVATLMYVMYEQFVREKSGLSATQGVVAALIEGYVPSDKLEAVAKAIADAIAKDVTGNGAKRTAEILTENSEECVTENEIVLLSKLIIEALAQLKI